MRRSRKHLLALAILSGLICAIVLVLDASRVWLVAGPAAITVLDTAALSQPARRLARGIARQWPNLGARHRGEEPAASRLQLRSWRFPLDWMERLLLPVPVVVTVVLLLSGPPWWLALLGVLFSLFAYAATYATYRAEWHKRAYPELGRALANSRVGRVLSRIPVLGTALETIFARRRRRQPVGNTIAGQVMSDMRAFSLDADISTIRSAPNEKLATLIADLEARYRAQAEPGTAESEPRLIALALSAPPPLLAFLDTRLAAAQRKTLARRRLGRPAVCEILGAESAGRLVLLDSASRVVFLGALLEMPPVGDVRIGEAAYPDDGASALALIAAAFERLRPLRDL